MDIMVINVHHAVSVLEVKFVTRCQDTVLLPVALVGKDFDATKVRQHYENMPIQIY